MLFFNELAVTPNGILYYATQLGHVSIALISNCLLSLQKKGIYPQETFVSLSSVVNLFSFFMARLCFLFLLNVESDCCFNLVKFMCGCSTLP